jgi:hypothetical protein
LGADGTSARSWASFHVDQNRGSSNDGAWTKPAVNGVRNDERDEREQIIRVNIENVAQEKGSACSMAADGTRFLKGDPSQFPDPLGIV